MIFIAYAFKGQEHVFAGRVKLLSHSSTGTSVILKYFCPLSTFEQIDLDPGIAYSKAWLYFYTPANFVCGGYTVFTLSVHPSVRP